MKKTLYKLVKGALALIGAIAIIYFGLLATQIATAQISGGAGSGIGTANFWKIVNSSFLSPSVSSWKVGSSTIDAVFDELTVTSCTGCGVGAGQGTVSTSSAITANYFPYWVGTGGTLNGTSTLYASSSRIGLGTISPSTTLDIVGSLRASGAATVATLNTGQGDYELYKMDQDVTATSSPTFSTTTITNFASSSQLKVTSSTIGILTIGGDSLNELCGTGITCTGNALTVSLGTSISVGELDSADFGGWTCNGVACVLDTDSVNDTHIDWGTGANQVSLDDVPDGSTYERVAAAELSSGIYKDATSAVKGISSFDTNHFTVTSGATSIALDAIDDTLIDWGTGAGQISIADLTGNQISGALAWDLGGATSFEVPNAAAGTTVDADGEVTVNTNSSTLNYYSTGVEHVLIATSTLKFGIASPSTSEDDAFHYAYHPMTIRRVTCINANAAGNTATFNIKKGTTTASSSAVFSSDQACTATSTPSILTINGSSTIATGETMRFTTSAASSSYFFVQVEYTNDP